MSDENTLERRVETLSRRVAEVSAGKVSKLTLVYFDIIGIAWPIRCLLHLSEVDYELIQMSFQEWFYAGPDGRSILKNSFRNGHIPLYADGDAVLQHSNLILEFLGDQHGFNGRNAAERQAVREVSAHAYDALFHFSGLFSINLKLGVPPDVVDARLKAFMGEGMFAPVTNGYASNLEAFRRYLQANGNGTGWMVGDTLTTADLHAFNILCNWYKAFDRDRFSRDYPDLDAYIQRVADNPKVADYIRRKQEPTVWFNLPEVALRLTSPEELKGLVRV